MQNSNGFNSWRLKRHTRTADFFPLGLFLLLTLANIITLPMISSTAIVSQDQYSIQSFHRIGCNGTHNPIYMKILSQICFNHSDGYHDSRYKECRKNCFTTAAFKSSAAMHYFVTTGILNADAWELYLIDLRALNGFDPQRRHI